MYNLLLKLYSPDNLLVGKLGPLLVHPAYDVEQRRGLDLEDHVEPAHVPPPVVGVKVKEEPDEVGMVDGLEDGQLSVLPLGHRHSLHG